MSLPNPSRPHRADAAAPAGTEKPDTGRRFPLTGFAAAAWSGWLHPLPLGLLAATVLASAVASGALRDRIERTFAQRFAALTEQIEQQVEARLAGCIQVLRGAQGLWSTDARLDRDGWRRYVSSLALEQDYAGLAALDFAPPDAALFRDDAVRGALARARDTGEAALSGRIGLPGEHGATTGFIVLLAVYRGDPATVAARQSALEGYVYMAFRSAELMKNTLGYKGLYARYNVYDGNSRAPADVLFATEQAPLPDPALSRATALEVAGHRWTVVSQPGALLGSPADQRLPQVVTLAGSLIAALVYALAVAWIRTRARALEIAAQMTADLQRREAELQELSAQLARSNEDLQHFAYAASHDLKEPLRSIASSLGLIGQRYSPRLDADAREFLGYANDGAQRLSGLIDNLLDFSRVHTHAEPMAAVDLNEVLSDALHDLGALLVESRVDLVRSEMPRVLADRAQITRVFENLIANAVKYSRGTGRPPQVMVTARHEAPHWIVSVSDNGIGIAPEHHERIFQMFKRLHTRTEYEGNGMGLALCRRIVQRHRGEIGVRSAPGEGATFWFSLPPAPPMLVKG